MNNPNDQNQNFNNNRDDLSFTDPNKEFIAKFIFDPDINDEADFTHLDKNIRLTNLLENKASDISEVDLMRCVFEAQHVLNQIKHFSNQEVKVLVGFNDKTNKDGSVVRVPIFEVQNKAVCKFPLSRHYWKSKGFSIEVTSASRNGWIYNKSRTQINERSDTLHDKTEVKSSFFGFGGNKNNNNQGGY